MLIYFFSQKVLNMLMSFEPRRMQTNDIATTDDSQDKFARTFSDLGGIEVRDPRLDCMRETIAAL